MSAKLSRVVGALSALVLSVGLSACATVTRGTKQALVIETDPPGALVEVNGQRATTPTSFKLSRKFEGPVRISKQGYETVTVQITSQVSTAGGVGMAGNVIIGGLIGMGIDTATGSTNELRPNPIHVQLVRLGDSGAMMAPLATVDPAPATPAAAGPVAEPAPAESTAAPGPKAEQPAGEQTEAPATAEPAALPPTMTAPVASASSP